MHTIETDYAVNIAPLITLNSVECTARCSVTLYSVQLDVQLLSFVKLYRSQLYSLVTFYSVQLCILVTLYSV